MLSLWETRVRSRKLYRRTDPGKMNAKYPPTLPGRFGHGGPSRGSASRACCGYKDKQHLAKGADRVWGDFWSTRHRIEDLDGAVSWFSLYKHLSPGNRCFLSQSRCLRRDQIVSLFDRGSTANGLRNFGNCGLRARLRSEYLQEQKDNISGETKQRESRKEIGSPTKEDLYKLQCRFRIEPELSHDSPVPTQVLCLRWLEIQADAGGSQSWAP